MIEVFKFEAEDEEYSDSEEDFSADENFDDDFDEEN